MYSLSVKIIKAWAPKVAFKKLMYPTLALLLMLPKNSYAGLVYVENKLSNIPVSFEQGLFSKNPPQSAMGLLQYLIRKHAVYSNDMTPEKLKENRDVIIQLVKSNFKFSNALELILPVPNTTQSKAFWESLFIENNEGDRPNFLANLYEQEETLKKQLIQYIEKKHGPARSYSNIQRLRDLEAVINNETLIKGLEKQKVGEPMLVVVYSFGGRYSLTVADFKTIKKSQEVIKVAQYSAFDASKFVDSWFNSTNAEWNYENYTSALFQANKVQGIYFAIDFDEFNSMKLKVDEPANELPAVLDED